VLIHQDDNVEVTTLRYENSVSHPDRTVHLFSTVEWLENKSPTFVTEHSLEGLIYTLEELRVLLNERKYLDENK
jgi:hypothetical protein